MDGGVCLYPDFRRGGIESNPWWLAGFPIARVPSPKSATTTKALSYRFVLRRVHAHFLKAWLYECHTHRQLVATS